MKTLIIKHLTTFGDYSPPCSRSRLHAAKTTSAAFWLVQSHRFKRTLNDSLLFTVWSLLSHIQYVFSLFLHASFFISLSDTHFPNLEMSGTWSVTAALTVKPWSASLVLLWATPLSRLTVVGQQLCLLPFLYAGGAHWRFQRKVGYV